MIPQRKRRKYCGVIKCLLLKDALTGAFVFCRWLWKAKGMAFVCVVLIDSREQNACTQNQLPIRQAKLTSSDQSTHAYSSLNPKINQILKI